MTARYPLLYRSLQISALLLIVLGVVIPQLLQQTQLLIAIGLILLVGIPHGATDYLIFQNLSRPIWGSKRLFQFYFNYLLLMFAYGLLWYLIPTLALSVFLLLSAYHFGQSNWNYLKLNSKWAEAGLFMLWGSFVVFTPVLWHYETSAIIISAIIGHSIPPVAQAWMEAICIGLLVINIWVVLYLFFQQKLVTKELRDELLNLVLLGLLFAFTPLMLGFAIYFVGWHSMTSVLDQVKFFRQQSGQYTWKDYIRNALPLTIVAITGLAGMGSVQLAMGIPLNIGLLFVFISIVTLPHMLLIDKLYEELSVAGGEETDHNTKDRFQNILKT